MIPKTDKFFLRLDGGIHRAWSAKRKVWLSSGVSQEMHVFFSMVGSSLSIATKGTFSNGSVFPDKTDEID